MQRPIKFRAWDKDKKEMLSNEWIQTLDLKGNGSWSVYLGGGLKQVARGDVYAQQNFKRENVELMQYTGLKDKNGKEIYEGDIVKFFGKELSKATIEWSQEDGGFTYTYLTPLTDKKCGMIAYPTHLAIEVIGNIYENPELLEKNNGD